jgi:hypothetical protein
MSKNNKITIFMKIFFIIILVALIIGAYKMYSLYLKPTIKLDANQVTSLQDSLPTDDNDYINNSSTGHVISLDDNSLIIKSVSGEINFVINETTIFRQSNNNGLLVEANIDLLRVGNLVTIFFQNSNNVKTAKMVDLINLY